MVVGTSALVLQLTLFRCQMVDFLICNTTLDRDLGDLNFITLYTINFGHTNVAHQKIPGSIPGRVSGDLLAQR